MTGETADRDARRPEVGSPRVFWTGVAVGGAVMAWGVYGLMTDAGPGATATRPARWLLWFVGALVVHDAVVAPLVLLTGRGVRRVAPVVLRTPLQVGLTLSAVVTLVAYPLLRGYGNSAQSGNTSILPGSYLPAWLTLLGVVWAAAAVLAFVQAVRLRRARRPG